MKKYLTGILAILIGLGLSSFTIPNGKTPPTKDFLFNPVLYPTQQNVAEPCNWISVTLFTCLGGSYQACKIKQVSPKYYHELILGTGIFVLNNASFIAGYRGYADQDDEVMVIPTGDGAVADDGVYIVTLNGTRGTDYINLSDGTPANSSGD